MTSSDSEGSAKYDLFSTHFRLEKAGLVSDLNLAKMNQPLPVGSMYVYIRF